MLKSSKRTFYYVGWSESHYRYADVIRFNLGADNLNEHMIEKFGVGVQDFEDHMRCAYKMDIDVFQDLMKRKILISIQSIEASTPDEALLSISGGRIKGLKRTSPIYNRLYREGDVLVERVNEDKYDVYAKKGVMCFKIWGDIQISSMKMS